MSGTQILQPLVNISLTNADASVENTDQRVLLVGQKVAAGSTTSGSLVQNISSSGAPENALFGQNSMLSEMIRAFKRLNKVVQIDVIPLDDNAGGTAREVEFTVVAPGATAGTITVTVGSVELHEFEVAIAVGDTATDVADAITAAVNADLDVGFTCANVAGVVTLTADNDGTVYNDLGIEVVLADTDATVASVTETVAGATDPVLTGVLDVATGRYQGVVWPYGDDTSVLESYLDPRFNPTTGPILDGVGFTTVQDTHANLLTQGNAENSESLVIFGDKQESETLYLGPAQNEASFVKSAYFAAIRSIRLTDGASIGSFLTSGASLDQFGGTALASLPYFNTPMDNLPTIKSGRGWTDDEIEQLKDAGIAVMGVNRAGTGSLVGEVPTTFKTDEAGNPDPTFSFLNYVDTSSNVREYYDNNLRSRFAQTRLTQGDVSRGRDMANEVVIRAYCEKLYQDLAGTDFVLVQDGETAFQFFKDNLTVDIDLSQGRATITAQVPIVTQLREILATFQITFSTQS